MTMCVSLYTEKLKYAGVWGTKQKPYPFREVESLEQPLMQTMKVSISFIMYTEKSLLDSVHERPGLSWLHTHAGREKHEKKEFRAINWDLRSNLFSPRKKEKRDADGSPFFPAHNLSTVFSHKEEKLPLFHVHLLLLQCKTAPLLSSAAGVCTEV